MRAIKIRTSFFLGSFLLIASFILSTPTALAQCGSESSSCKSCHEVQAEYPVNNDGTGWHESHAFGDFCYICHAGNLQATDEEGAHEGMVPPLSDIRASCQSCHPNDTNERAEIYASALGVALGGESNTPTPAAAPTTESQAAPVVEQSTTTEEQAAAVPVAEQSTECPVVDVELAYDDPNMVDYAQRYNEIVLGERPVNWGNIALIGMIGLVVLGGGGFVIVNEVRRSHQATTDVEGEYPLDVVEMLPQLSKLKSKSRESLKNILSQPEKTDKVLGLLDSVISDDETKG